MTNKVGAVALKRKINMACHLLSRLNAIICCTCKMFLEVKVILGYLSYEGRPVSIHSLSDALC